MRPNEFDLVIKMYTSFGYFEDPADDDRAASLIMESLKPGGCLVMEIMGKEILARIFLPRSWDRCGDILVIQERNVTNCWSWIENEWTLIKGDRSYRHEIAHRMFSGVEIARLFRDAGASETACFGNLSGVPYDHTAERLVLIAHK